MHSAHSAPTFARRWGFCLWDLSDASDLSDRLLNAQPSGRGGRTNISPQEVEP
jgi:hypothetical protein